MYVVVLYTCYKETTNETKNVNGINPTSFLPLIIEWFLDLVISILLFSSAVKTIILYVHCNISAREN